MRGRGTADYGVTDSGQVNDVQQSGDKNQNNYPGSQNEENRYDKNATFLETPVTAHLNYR